MTGPHYRAKRGAELGGGKSAAGGDGRTVGTDGCKGVFVWGGDFTGEPARMHSLQQWRGGDHTAYLNPPFLRSSAGGAQNRRRGREGESEDDLP